MSRTRVLPKDVRDSCLAYVRGYARRREEYINRRAEILSVSTSNVVTIKDPDDPEDEDKHEGVILPGSHHASRTAEDMAAKIEELEQQPETKRMRAVEYAAGKVGRDLTEDQRKMLVNAIFTSCIQGRKYPFERLQVEGMERSCFYDRRMKFLVDIAKYMEMI